MDTTVAMLDELTELEAKRDLLTLDIDAEIAKIEAQAAPLRQKRAELTADVDVEIVELTAAITQAIILKGASVKASRLHCVYTSPRVTWDTKGLEGYAIAHPELEAFRRVGKASASIRRVK